MPDILIRGMEKPKTCADCHDADLPTAIAWIGAKCPWAHGIIDPGVYDLRHERHPDCPLHELPPHGDLIDKDKAMNAILGEPPEAHYPSWYAAIVNEIPAIVPSNKEESFDTREDRP